METTATIDTGLALVRPVAPDLIEVHFKPGITLTSEGIQAIIGARRTAAVPGVPPRVLILLPDQVDFEMTMITTDQYKGHPVEVFSRAVAWVVRTPVNESLARLYFTYFPSPVPTEVFLKECEARAWLEGR